MLLIRYGERLYVVCCVLCSLAPTPLSSSDVPSVVMLARHATHSRHTREMRAAHTPERRVRHDVSWMVLT